MITAVGVHLVQVPFVPNLVIPAIDPSPYTPLVIKNITGLEPVPAVVNTRGYGAQDGEFYVGSNVGKRNIVLTIMLNTSRGSVSVSEARNLLYGYCMPKTIVKLIFYSDDRPPVEIEGFAETHTPNRFSQDPEQQISFICPKPNFVSPERKLAGGFSSVSPAETQIQYNGTLIAGITLALTMSGPLYGGRVVIESRLLGSGPTYRKIELANAYYAPGGYLWVNTNQGKKVVQSWHPAPSPIRYNLLDKMSDASLWTFLASGVNLVRVRTPDSNVQRSWVLDFYEQFGAI